MNEFTSLLTVLSDFYEDDNIIQRDVDESLILKWATDITDEIITDQQLNPKVAWLEVNNYKTDRPPGVELLLEVAYKVKDGGTPCDIKGYEITQYVQNTNEGCQLEMNVVCPSCSKSTCDCHTEGVVVDIGTSWEISHPEMFYENYVKVGRFGYGNSAYSADWKILRHTDSEWFGLNKVLPDCAMIHCIECPHTYAITPSTIETSFKKGEILVSYMGKVTDENGDIMVPKHRYVFEAILQHLTYKWFRREFISKGDPHYRLLYMEAKEERNRNIMDAKSILGRPSFDEFSKYWSKNKWNKLDSAYQNLLDGNLGYVDLPDRNIYKR